MKVAIFSTKPYDREFLDHANASLNHELVYFEPHLSVETVKLAFGFPAICVFVNDTLDRDVLQLLAEHGTRLITLRCAGFNNVDLKAAKEFGLIVLRVPAYAPHGVAEHAVALMLSLNRKIYRSHNRVREGNFSLDGLLGFEFYKKTIGIVGTGKIGAILAKIASGFEMNILLYDKFENEYCKTVGGKYVELKDLYAQSDIISLHVPLMKETYHMIDKEAITHMKDDVMLINTSRGGLINTQHVIDGLKAGKIGSFGLDVYEEEGDVFFEDVSNTILQDDVLARLLTFPNVIFTGHQAFFTVNALQNISDTTIENISDFENKSVKSQNDVLSLA